MAENAIEVLPVTNREIKQALDNDVFNRFLKKLDEDVQGKVKTEAYQLAAAMHANIVSRVAIAAHLTALHEILEPLHLFEKFIRNFHFTKRTAYRYIAAYENAGRAVQNETLMKVAAIRGINILGGDETKPLGKYTAAAAIYPPPKTANDETAVRYWDDLEKTRKEINADPKRRAAAEKQIEHKAIRKDPRTLMKKTFQIFRATLRRVPSRSRDDWFEELIGMMLTEAGFQSAKSLKPCAVPEDFKAGRGRPRELAQVASA